MVMFVLRGKRIGSNSVMVQPKVDVLAFGIRFPAVINQITSQKNNSPGGLVLRSKKFEPYPNEMFKAPMGFSFGISHVSSLYIFFCYESGILPGVLCTFICISTVQCFGSLNPGT